MQLSYIMLMTIYLAIMAPFTKSIMSLGALLLSSALLMTALTSQMTNSWFAFVLFLVYITGLLVLFSYMMSMSPNSYYTKKKSSMINITLLTLFLTLTMSSYYPFTVINPMKSEKSFEQDVVQTFSPISVNLFWMTGVILLIALLMAVTICHKSPKPMRSYMG